VTQIHGDTADGVSARTQVLLGEMPLLIADLVREAIAGLDVELVPTVEDLRPAGGGPPPVAIVAVEGREASAVASKLMLGHPEAVLLEVELDGRELSVQALFPSHNSLGVLTARRLADAIMTAPRWDERFGA
jgi:hypothetical protein